MTDKVQKIREEVERIINRRLNLINGDYFDLNEETNGFTNEIMNVIDSLQEEPVSEEIGNYNHTAVLEGLGYQSKEEPVISNVNVEPIGVPAGVVELANVHDRKEYTISLEYHLKSIGESRKAIEWNCLN